MLADSGATVLLTSAGHRQRWRGPARPYSTSPARTRPARPAGRVLLSAGPANVAYVIYTSGSTGRPKGSAIEHRSLANYVRWFIRRFGLGPADRVLASTAPSFDAFGIELFPALVAGGTVVVAPESAELDPDALLGLAAAEGVTMIATVPTVLRLLVDSAALARCAAVRQVVVGGEQLSGKLAADFAERLAVPLHNLYGPTEATIDVAARTCLPADRQADAVPIGGPLANARLYLLDQAGELVPVGAVGHLHVGGVPVGRGYPGRPGLTAERFVPDPFGPPGSRLYQTGDLARWTADGVLALIGRADSQIKIRGLRIEPAEIEVVLREQPGVRDAAVVAREEAPGDRRLAAYVLAGPEADTGAMRTALRRSLPEYMVPAAIVPLQSFPTTSHGKLDVAGLPAPDYAAGAGHRYLAPRTACERLIAAVWTEVLGVARVGAEDDFFDLGGHSLLAARIAVRLSDVIGSEVPIHLFFSHVTVSELARAIEELMVRRDRCALRRRGLPHAARGGHMTTTPKRELSATKRALLEQRLGRAPGRTAAAPPSRIPGARPGSAPPMSFAQERVWFMEQYAPGTAAYAIPIAVRLRGPFDTSALQRAIDRLVSRHEALRMTFPATVDGRPRSPRRRGRRGAAGRRDTTGGPDQAGVRHAACRGRGTVRPCYRPAATLAAHVAGRRRPCACPRGSPYRRRRLVQRRAGARACRALPGGRNGQPAELAELPIQYGDFALWQREQLAGPGFDRHRRYWTGQLAGVPPLNLPADRPRPPTQRFEGATHRFAIDAQLATALAGLGRAHGATLFMTLLAGYQALLARHCGQRDFAVGTPVAGRTRPEVENLVGMFVNMLALRVEMADDPCFAELLTRTRRVVLDGLRYQEMPFEQVVAELGMERDVARSPLFQATFALHNFEMNTGGSRSRSPAAGAGLTGTWEALNLPVTRFDLELQAVATDSDLACMFTYNTALFEPATIGRLAERFEVLLRAAVAEPSVPVSRLALLNPGERAVLTGTGTGTAVGVPADATLHALIEAQAARTPLAVAVSAEDESLSYAELNRRANMVAHRLRAAGAGPETLVGVCAERSAELVVALLGVLKSGAAYVPLEPGYPAERLGYMVEDSGAPIVLTQCHLAGLLPVTDALVMLLDEPAESAGQPGHDPGRIATPPNPAYMIYTSGSTGRPKGVPNTHAAICNRLDWMQRTYPLCATDSVLQKTPTGFDVSVWEIFWPLLAGARVVLARPGGHKDPAYLRDLIVAEHVNVAHFVPSMLTAFLSADGVAGCRSLGRVICSGEELPLGTAAQFCARLPGCELHNLYGPTEAAIDVSAWHCDPAALASVSAIPIGRPIQNIRLYVLDQWLAPVPAGVAGELFIGGAGLARGYWRRPALTAERFIPDPFGPPGARLYHTGDLARWTSAGVLEFLGRNDSQVKLRGQRIELGEIEARLRDHVREATVMVREDRPGDQRLVAYVVPAAAGVTDGSLRRALKRSLPDYMVPAAFVTLSVLPLTPNGKLDRAALPAPERGVSASTGYVPPRTETEAALARVWAEVLGLDRVSVEDDFFDLGGHSMLATQVVARLRTVLAGTRRSLGVMDMFTHRTVAELARTRGGPGAAGPTAPALRADRAGADGAPDPQLCLPAVRRRQRRRLPVARRGPAGR